MLVLCGQCGPSALARPQLKASVVTVDGMAWHTRKSPCPIWTMLVCWWTSPPGKRNADAVLVVGVLALVVSLVIVTGSQILETQSRFKVGVKWSQRIPAPSGTQNTSSLTLQELQERYEFRPATVAGCSVLALARASCSMHFVGLQRFSYRNWWPGANASAALRWMTLADLAAPVEAGKGQTLGSMAAGGQQFSMWSHSIGWWCRHNIPHLGMEGRNMTGHVDIQWYTVVESLEQLVPCTEWVDQLPSEILACSLPQNAIEVNEKFHGYVLARTWTIQNDLYFTIVEPSILLLFSRPQVIGCRWISRVSVVWPARRRWRRLSCLKLKSILHSSGW